MTTRCPPAHGHHLRVDGPVTRDYLVKGDISSLSHHRPLGGVGGERWGYAKGEVPPCQVDIQPPAWLTMPRSKSVHLVTQQIVVDQPDDPTAPITANIDLALLLSQQIGRNIRQGNSFRVVGVGATLGHSAITDDADTGIAANVNLRYCPTNRHGVKAWQQMFAKWKKQKQLSGKIGQYVKYDDFEVCWGAGANTSRTSTVFAGGMGDTAAEYIAIYDNASSGVRTTLSDMYNSYQPLDGAGTDEFGVSIKSPKFQTHFPQPALINTTAHLSANADWTQSVEVLGVTDAVASSVHYMGASSESNMTYLPSDNHLNVMCGLFNVQAFILPPDVDTGPDPPTAETDWYLTITIAVEGWSSLAPKRTYKPRRMARKSSYKSRGKTYGRRRYYRRS